MEKQEELRLLREYQDIYKTCRSLQEDVKKVERDYERASQDPNPLKTLSAVFFGIIWFILRVFLTTWSIVILTCIVIVIVGLPEFLFPATVEPFVNPFLNTWLALSQNWLFQHISALPTNLYEWALSAPENIDMLLFLCHWALALLISFLYCTISLAWKLGKAYKISREIAYNRLHMEELEAKRETLKRALEKAQTELDGMDEKCWGVFSRDYAEEIDRLIEWMEEGYADSLKEALNLMDDIRYRENVYEIVKCHIELQNKSMKLGSRLWAKLWAKGFQRRIKQTLSPESPKEEFYDKVHDWLDYQESRASGLVADMREKADKAEANENYWNDAVSSAELGFSRWGTPLEKK